MKNIFNIFSNKKKTKKYIRISFDIDIDNYNKLQSFCPHDYPCLFRRICNSDIINESLSEYFSHRCFD